MSQTTPILKDVKGLKSLRRSEWSINIFKGKQMEVKY